MSFSHMALDGKSLMFFKALMRVSVCESDIVCMAQTPLKINNALLIYNRRLDLCGPYLTSSASSRDLTRQSFNDPRFSWRRSHALSSSFPKNIHLRTVIENEQRSVLCSDTSSK